MAARSGAVSESYLQETVAPVVLGRDPHDREAIFQELWVIDRHEAFFPVSVSYTHLDVYKRQPLPPAGYPRWPVR